MKDDKQNEGLSQPQNGSGAHRPRRGHKKLIVTIVVLLVCLVAGLTAAYLLMRNSAESTLTESLQNTLKLQQMKFHVDLSNPATSENMQADGVYKKGAGLSASVKSTTINSGVQTTKHSQWVIDASGNVYANLSLFDVKIIDSKSTLNTPENVKSLVMASQVNTQSNKDVWVKLDASGLKYSSSYGLQACTLSMFYKVQSDPKTFQDFMKQLVGSHNLDIKKASNTYTIAANSDRNDAIGSLYTKSALYKSLAACDETQYGATSQSMNDILKRTTVDIKVDTAKKVITSVAVKVKDGITLNATLTDTNGVTISVPKVSRPPALKSSDTPESYLKKNAEYLYKNFKNIEKNVNNPNNLNSINSPKE